MTRAEAAPCLLTWMSEIDDTVQLIYDAETDWRLVTSLLWSLPIDQPVIYSQALNWPGFSMARHHENLLNAFGKQ